MQRKIILLFIVLAAFVLLFFGIRFLISNRQQQGKAGLKVVSNPGASLFLDSRFLGRTPYEEKVEPGEYYLKLIPESTATTTASWQDKVILQPNILTVVNRELGSTDLKSAGEIVSLEKLSGKETEISVITNPSGASVKIDGQDKGSAPLLLRNIEPGDHEIAVLSTGFINRSIKVKAVSGYKLIVNIQIALAGDAPPAISPAVSGQPQTTPEEGQKMVQILDTPTGWLRVRSEPSTSASEAGKVNPGEKFPVIEEKTGWYKIKMTDGSEGWISGRYAEKVK
jgi:hypothetical protein